MFTEQASNQTHHDINLARVRSGSSLTHLEGGREMRSEDNHIMHRHEPSDTTSTRCKPISPDSLGNHAQSYLGESLSVRLLLRGGEIRNVGSGALAVVYAAGRASRGSSDFELFEPNTLFWACQGRLVHGGSTE